MGFEASKTAIFASQKALDIVGQNLANMSTEGYTRQRTDQVSVANYAYRSRVGDTSYNHIGMGTNVEGISQTRDERMDTAFRNSYSDTSYYSKSNEMFSELETIISEIDVGIDGNGYGLSWGLEQMYSSLSSLSNNVNLPANATLFADTVHNMTSLLNKTSQELEDACNIYKDQLATEVKDVNLIMEDIATLNKQISDVMAGAGYTEQYGPNELIDKRNMLLDELSSFGKVEVKNKTDGTVDVKLNNHQCIKGKETDRIVFQENRDNTVSLLWKSTGEGMDKQNGILKASAEIINGRGLNSEGVSGSDTRGFKYYQDQLDAFAVQLAEILNNTVPDPDYDGTASGAPYPYKKLVGESEFDENGNEHIYVNRKVTAANITISDEFYSNPSYILPDKSSSDNSYFLDMMNKLMNDKHTFTNGVESYEGTLQGFVIDYAAKIGSDVSFSQSKYEACEKYSNELQDNRENITGVSESEETVAMLTHNRAFQAAAKMMTTMDELLDVIINQIGALG
jgi:flagellar hook-associated protein 1 FlgK